MEEIKSRRYINFKKEIQGAYLVYIAALLMMSCNMKIPNAQKVSYRMLEDTIALEDHYNAILSHLPDQEAQIKNIRIKMNASSTPGNRNEDYLLSVVTMQEKMDELRFISYDSRTGWDLDDKEAIPLSSAMPKNDWWKTSLWKPQKYPVTAITKAVQQALSDPRKTSQPDSFVDLIVVDKTGIVVHVVVPGYVDGPNGGFNIVSTI